MRRKKFERKFFKNIPVLFLSVVLFSVSIFLFSYFSKLIISKQNLLTPLSQFRGKSNSSVNDLLSKNKIQFAKVDRDTVFLRDGGVVYLDLSKNISSQISSLQLILQRLTIEGKKFKKLDLRFDTPIIEF